ncbi:MAG: 2OG-Fe(II) oxygenase [Acetobacteraceae bacterium]|nr:2OG-Fe(II) oxygenase [Acetobacteraceae bacterium]
MTRHTREMLAPIIAERVRSSGFEPASPDVPTRQTVIDDLLPAEIAAEIFQKFPIGGENFTRRVSFRERKSTSAALDSLDPLLAEISFALQSPEVLAAVASISGMTDLEPDASLYAGGLSMMRKGDFLNPHIDNSHDAARSRYRRINLLYYVAPDWTLENGGNLELWDDDVRRPVTLVSKFNRLILMETNRRSWHSVSPVAADGVRCCVSSYYFSKSPPETDEYFHVTQFSARPEQPVRRIYARADAAARNFAGTALGLGRGRDRTYKPPS